MSDTLIVRIVSVAPIEWLVLIILKSGQIRISMADIINITEAF